MNKALNFVMVTLLCVCAVAVCIGAHASVNMNALVAAEHAEANRYREELASRALAAEQSAEAAKSSAAAADLRAKAAEESARMSPQSVLLSKIDTLRDQVQMLEGGRRDQQLRNEGDDKWKKAVLDSLTTILQARPK
jgi:cell division protein FtsL